MCGGCSCACGTTGAHMYVNVMMKKVVMRRRVFAYVYAMIELNDELPMFSPKCRFISISANFPALLGAKN